MSSTDEVVLAEGVVNRLSSQAQRTFTPWLGFQSENWLFLSSLQYNIWEYRSWTQEDQDLENLGQIEVQQQCHRLWMKDDFLATVGLGVERNLAVSNRSSTLFTEEEQKDPKYEGHEQTLDIDNAKEYGQHEFLDACKDMGIVKKDI